MSTSYDESGGSLEEIDTAAIAGEIAGELGLGGERTEALSGEEPSDPHPAASPQSAADGPAPGTAAFDAMPKAWKKEMEAHWSRLDPEVRKYVNAREADVSRGIQMYQQGHSSWNQLLEPYQEIFQAYPNVDPVALMQGVMNQHIQLAKGTPEQKRAVAAQMLKAYGLEFPAGEGQTPAPQTSAEVEELRQRLSQVEGLWKAAQNAAQQESYEKNLSSVEAFAADKANKYWPEVVEDVYTLLKKGAASTLPEAYEIACFRNPRIRAEMVAPPPPAAPGRSPKFPNLNGDTGGAPRGRKMSIDDTINSVVDKHFSTH
jgi:hypothetical protein